MLPFTTVAGATAFTRTRGAISTDDSRTRWEYFGRTLEELKLSLPTSCRFFVDEDGLSALGLTNPSAAAP